jgi:long-chain acyl-CoA synthetase
VLKKLNKEIFSLPSWAREGFSAFRERLLHKSADKEKPWIRHYDAGVPYELEVPGVPVYQFLQRAFAEAGPKPALLYYNRRLSYNHLYAMVTRFASGLQRLGVKPGQPIALCMPNIPQFLIAYWAALYVGAVVVLINPLLSEREMRHQLSLSRAEVLVVLDRFHSRVERVRAQTQVRHVVVAFLESYMSPIRQLAFQFGKRLRKAEEKIKRGQGTFFFRQLLKQPPLTRAVEVDPGSAAVMLFTGGVTGIPKAAVLSHNNVVMNALQARAWISDIREGEEVVMAALPLSHSYAMSACHHLAVLCKGMLVLEPRFEVKKICRHLQRYKVTLFPGVPTMFSSIVNRLMHKPMDLSSIRSCISGGASLPRIIKERFEKLTGARLLEGYGLTEASPVTHCTPVQGGGKEGSIGLPWPGTSARIVDLQSREVLGPGKVGELQVRGPQVMLGYFEQEEATREVLDAEGWLSTGDIAFQDKEGYFFIVDRKKEIFFSGGYNVYPAEIERVLMEHPAVAEAAVVPIHDDYYGEAARAYLVLRPRMAQPATAELLAFCLGRLARYKIPQQFVFVDELPKNLVGKVLKRELMMREFNPDSQRGENVDG